MPPDGLAIAALSTARPCGGTDAALTLLPGITLRQGRVHEACGPARRLLAAWAMGATATQEATAATIWIRPAWSGDRVNPHGLAGWAPPGPLVMVDCPQSIDLMWCAEEALRAGSAALVVIDLPDPPELTPVRRLHLAAETGAARARARRPGQDRRRPAALAPMGLLLTPGTGGGAGVETRWHLDSLPPPPDRSERWRLTRLRARTAPPAAWTVTRPAAYAPKLTIRSTPLPAAQDHPGSSS